MTYQKHDDVLPGERIGRRGHRGGPGAVRAHVARITDIGGRFNEETTLEMSCNFQKRHGYNCAKCGTAVWRMGKKYKEGKDGVHECKKRAMMRGAGNKFVTCRYNRGDEVQSYYAGERKARGRHSPTVSLRMGGTGWTGERGGARGNKGAPRLHGGAIAETGQGWVGRRQPPEDGTGRVRGVEGIVDRKRFTVWR